MNWRRALQRSLEDPATALETSLALARGRYYLIKFRLLGRRVRAGRFFRVRGPLDIRGPGTVIFGDHCSVVSSRLSPTTPYTHKADAVIRFGNRVALSGTRLGCERSIEVGDDAGLADARIMDTDFHSIEISDEPRENTRGRCKPIVIGPKVWVGAGAMILKGVTIGESAVVSAGAVVASAVPPRSVVLGNPARVIWRIGDVHYPLGAAAAKTDGAQPPASCP